MLLLSRVGTNIGQQCHMTGTLQRDAQGPLVAGASAGLSPGLNLGALREVFTQARHVFVINVLDLVHAEAALLAARHVAIPVPRPAAVGATAPASATVARASAATTVARASPSAA